MARDKPATKPVRRPTYDEVHATPRRSWARFRAVRTYYCASWKTTYLWTYGHNVEGWGTRLYVVRIMIWDADFYRNARRSEDILPRKSRPGRYLRRKHVARPERKHWMSKGICFRYAVREGEPWHPPEDFVLFRDDRGAYKARLGSADA